MSIWPELADAFRALDYRVDAVVGLIGAEAHAALARNSTVPATRALAGRDDPLATLTRLWLLQQPVPVRRWSRRYPGWSSRWSPPGSCSSTATRCGR